jgi:hypothetical protein
VIQRNAKTKTQSKTKEKKMKTLKATPSKTLADLSAEMGFAPAQGQTVKVEFTATIKGELSKGENYLAAQTCNALGLEDIALAFVSMGATKNAVRKMVCLAALGKLKVSEDKRKLAEECAEEIRAVFQRLPKAEREGKRTGKLTVVCDAGLI